MPPTVAPQRPAFLDGPLQLYIGGRRVTTADRLATVDPATGETLAEVPVATTAEVDLAVQAAADAFRGWRGTPATERARMLWTLADLIESRSEELAAIEVLDNGKPIGEARAVDIALTIEIFRYYAGWTTKIAGSVPPNSIRGMLTMIRREPVGVVAAITPWNFPLLEVAYKLGPALAAGCTVVVKPSELAPLSTLRLMDLVEEAGLPAGVVNAIIGGPEIGAALVRHPGVQKVAFTGQTATGIEIARQAAGDLKRVTLELGGKSPNIIFADADLDAAVGGAFGGIFFNQGEACVAGSRLFVEASVEREVTERLVAKAAGDPARARARPGHRHGTADLGEPPPPGPRPRGRGPRGRGTGRRGRRRGPAGRPGAGVLHRAHGGARGQQRHAGRPGGDLRPGAVGDQLAHG